MVNWSRADCIDGPRPCPIVRCRYHLALDIKGSGAIHLPSMTDKSRVRELRDIDVASMTETCALDVADRGEHDLRTIGELLNISAERVRQIEETAIKRLTEYIEEDPDQELAFQKKAPPEKFGSVLDLLGLTKEKSWLIAHCKELTKHDEPL